MHHQLKDSFSAARSAGSRPPSAVSSFQDGSGQYERDGYEYNDLAVSAILGTPQ